MKTEKANILLILTDQFSHFNNNIFLWKSERDFQWSGITERKELLFLLPKFCMQPIPKSKLETDNILLTL